MIKKEESIKVSAKEDISKTICFYDESEIAEGEINYRMGEGLIDSIDALGLDDVDIEISKVEGETVHTTMGDLFRTYNEDPELFKSALEEIGELDKFEKIVSEFVWQDTDFFNWMLEDQEMELTTVLNEMSPDGYWSIRGEKMGWRNLSGEKRLEGIDKGDEFLSQILPSTQCSFYIYKEDDHLRISNYHHDSPMGETFYCYPMREEEYYLEEEG